MLKLGRRLSWTLTLQMGLTAAKEKLPAVNSNKMLEVGNCAQDEVHVKFQLLRCNFVYVSKMR